MQILGIQTGIVVVFLCSLSVEFTLRRWTTAFGSQSAKIVKSNLILKYFVSILTPYFGD